MNRVVIEFSWIWRVERWGDIWVISFERLLPPVMMLPCGHLEVPIIRPKEDEL